MGKAFSEMDELEIIKDAQIGDNEAMAYLMEKYKGLVRALARPLFLVDGDQDDLVQEGMIGLFKAIRSYHPDKEAGFETFANLCISRQLYSAIKISNRKKNIPLNSYISIDATGEAEEQGEAERIALLNQSLADWQRNPEEIVIGQENARDVRKRMFGRLSRLEKEVLQLFLRGLTYQEIARELGKPPKTVDNALQRIKAKLAKLS